MSTQEKNDPIDYPALIADIRHELKKVYHFNMHPALVLDAIDILIHEKTGLACISDASQEETITDEKLPPERRTTP